MCPLFHAACSVQNCVGGTSVLSTVVYHFKISRAPNCKQVVYEMAYLRSLSSYAKLSTLIALSWVWKRLTISWSCRLILETIEELKHYNAIFGKKHFLFKVDGGTIEGLRSKCLVIRVAYSGHNFTCSLLLLSFFWRPRVQLRAPHLQGHVCKLEGMYLIVVRVFVQWSHWGVILHNF